MSAKPRFQVVSLFAGCGGSSLGYRLAGGEVLLSVEWDDNAAATYRLNHPKTLLFHRDIATVTGEEILYATGLESGELDILDGSPPCQGFSTAGKRKINDSRNRLFEEYLRFVQILQPKVFVMENVAGMAKGSMKRIFAEILQALKDCGYRVSARLMNAKYYGVPQSRQRIIFMGVRQDLDISPSHPTPQTVPIILKDALRDVQVSTDFERPTGKGARIAECLKPGEDGAQLHERFNGKGIYYSLKRLSWYEVAPTICKTLRPGQCGLLHPDENRYLSIPEVKRIASFPDDSEFTGTIEQQWARIGNSVPPLLMKAIADHIYENILSKTDSFQTQNRSYKKGG